MLVLRLEGGNLLFEGELNQNNFSIEMKRQKWFKTNRNGQFFLQQHTETHTQKHTETHRNAQKKTIRNGQKLTEIDRTGQKQT